MAQLQNDLGWSRSLLCVQTFVSTDASDTPTSKTSTYIHLLFTVCRQSLCKHSQTSRPHILPWTPTIKARLTPLSLELAGKEMMVLCALHSTFGILSTQSSQPHSSLSHLLFSIALKGTRERSRGEEGDDVREGKAATKEQEGIREVVWTWWEAEDYPFFYTSASAWALHSRNSTSNCRNPLDPKIKDTKLLFIT